LGCLDALLAATLAPACAACHAPLDSPSRGCICAVCLGGILPATLAPWTSAHVSIGLAAGRYDGALRDVIHAFKYEGRRSLGDPLASLMREAGRSVLEDCDCVVPVPLHPWRRLRRGFNQARDLAERLDRPVVNALWRVRATSSQMALNAATRHTNVRNAFVLSPLVTGGMPLRGACVVLVDDVRTTGSTLDECAKVLRRAGATDVHALTVAAA
jgi:ComF family protein